MKLTPSQNDALTELINIGYARAAAALSDLTGHRISLEVPDVAIHTIPEITDKLQQLLHGEVASVNQVFTGPITGNGILLLDGEAALLRWPAAYRGTNPGITCAGWSASQTAIGSRQGRNHHNFNEHPRSPKVGREASPRRRICRIDPLVPNRIVIFEQTHVSDPDLGA